MSEKISFFFGQGTRGNKMASGELYKMTKAELMKLARSKKLNVNGRMLKTELIELLSRRGIGKRPRTAASKKRKTPVTEKRGAAAAKKRSGKAVGKRAKTAAKASGKAPPAKAPKRAKAAKASRKASPAKAPKRAKAAKASIKTAPVKTRKRAKKALPAKTPKRRATTAIKGAGKEAATRTPAAHAKEINARTIRQKAVASKYYLGAEEKVMPPVESMDIPAGYGFDRVAIMIRDPHWVFAYWEVTRKSYLKLEKLFGDDWPTCRMILRVYDRSSSPSTHFDIELSAEASNWYINVLPEHTYQVAIGALGQDGRFEEIAVSNIIETPRFGISDVIDDRWMVPDEVFDRVFAASGGYDMHASSAELRELLEKGLLEQISSGAVSSFGSGPLREEERGRGFRLWIATELILYGATEPDARVTVQGKEVKLRGDGTFSLRFALPDGRIDLPVKAVSADELEERSIDTNVRKKSERKEPVLK